MDTTQSPTPTPACAALPPGVSCREKSTGTRSEVRGQHYADGQLPTEPRLHTLHSSLSILSSRLEAEGRVTSEVRLLYMHTVALEDVALPERRGQVRRDQTMTSSAEAEQRGALPAGRNLQVERSLSCEDKRGTDVLHQGALELLWRLRPVNALERLNARSRDRESRHAKTAGGERKPERTTVENGSLKAPRRTLPERGDDITGRHATSSGREPLCEAGGRRGVLSTGRPRGGRALCQVALSGRSARALCQGALAGRSSRAL
ncbi:hypothetical protein EYF80_056963 [Liparis tanakae]|uniref:Uncharacterized protein n=1 Tax=Liparis tanakae TaxID=230148 RepID=A0A4Z2EVI1_9TELE|nr:hypothetical protein EYF80_056963 [Liparis tanakae]